MQKESFSNIQRIDRGSFFRKVVIVLGIAAAVIAVLIVVHSLLSRDSTPQVVEEAPTPPAVPTDIRYYDPAEGESYSTGVDYIMMNRSDGTSVRVSQDGSVYLLDQYGNVVRQLTGAERQAALGQALDISSVDSQAAIALSGLDQHYSTGTESEQPSLSAADIRAMMEDDTASYLMDEYGVTIDDFYKLLYDNGLTPEQYYQNLENGSSMDTLIDTAMASRGNAGETDAPQQGQDMQISFGTAEDTDDTSGSITLPSWMDTSDITETMNASMDTLAQAVMSTNQSQPSSQEQMRESVNRTNEQIQWLENQQNVELTSGRITNWDLVAGTVVPITLVTGLNTDLPGEVVGLVRQDVYDSLTGSTILIPKGTRLMANYNSSVAFGQKSVQIAWTQMITPDGYVFSLPGFQGVDPQGFTGVSDKYSSHFWSILGGAFLGSIINLGSGYTQQQLEMYDQLTNSDYATLLGTGMTDQIENFGQQYVNQMINRQPTIRIRTGTETLLLVNQTINLRRQ